MLTYKRPPVLEEEHPLVGSANHRPLTPLEYLPWVATVYSQATAWVYGEQSRNYADFYERCCQLAGALKTLDLNRGEVVAVLAPNVPLMLEAHFGAPMAGLVICPLSPMRDAATIAYILEHSETKLLLVDSGCRKLASDALSLMAQPPKVIEAEDASAPVKGKRLGKVGYEEFVARGSANFEWPGPRDEWETLILSYTLGTAGLPKGVLLHHRGAYLDATGSIITQNLNHQSVYLWSLPMCRAGGWGYLWAVTAVGGTHVLTRANQPDGEDIFRQIERHGVTHMSGKRGVLERLVGAASGREPLHRPVHLDLLQQDIHPHGLEVLESQGFEVSFLYGLTETFGPAAICRWKQDDSLIGRSDMPMPPGIVAHPGAHFPTLDRMIVADPETQRPLPADGKTVGEILLRGNTIFKGYHKAPEATEKALRSGWFHTGDLGIMHRDGHVEILQRGCDALHDTANHCLNVTSNAEQALCRHPAVKEAVIVEQPAYGREDPDALEPIAFITLKDDRESRHVTEADLMDYCHRLLPESVRPVRVEVRDNLPRNEDGDILRYRLRQEG